MHALHSMQDVPVLLSMLLSQSVISLTHGANKLHVASNSILMPLVHCLKLSHMPSYYRLSCWQHPGDYQAVDPCPYKQKHQHSSTRACEVGCQRFHAHYDSLAHCSTASLRPKASK